MDRPLCTWPDEFTKTSPGLGQGVFPRDMSLFPEVHFRYQGTSKVCGGCKRGLELKHKELQHQAESRTEG